MGSLSSQQRFSNRVADYVRYRPGYPPALMEWIHGELEVPSTATVADIGAGTGISTRMFLEAGHEVFAVEPNAAMRGAAEAWLAGYPRFHAMDASAEATTLGDASIDLVSAAQAFHWFDPEAVRREWARILVPGGLAVVYWNSRLLDASPFLRGYEQLLLEYGTDYSAVAERYADDETMQRWFGAGLVASVQLPNVQRVDFDALRGRLLSSSYAPLEGDPRHAPMLAALRELFDRHQQDGHVDIDYRTRAFAGTLNRATR
jgi:SAM-dependent methyltransferase